jgi:hypothetical protein
MSDLLNNEIQGLVDLRNSQLRSQGKSPIWRRVTGLSNAFKKHGYCAQEKYYRWAEDSCDQQGDFRGTLHPNEAGSDAISRILEQELRLVMPDFHSQPVFE